MGRDHPDPRAAGDRIGQLLDGVHAAVGARTWASVEELVRILTDLYGDGLARTVELLGGGDPIALKRLAGDELVSSLLLLHGLHPDGLEYRVRRAVETVGAALRGRGGEVELVEIDEDGRRAHVLVTTGGHGSASAGEQIAALLADAVPDASITVSVAASPVPVRLGSKPVSASRGA